MNRLDVTAADIAGHIRTRLGCSFAQAREAVEVLRHELLPGDHVATWGAVLDAVVDMPAEDLAAIVGGEA